MQRATWTDERLDGMGQQIDGRFDQVDRRFDQIDRRFEQMDRRIENEVGGLRLEMSGMRSELRREMGCMHSDLKDDIKEFRLMLNRVLIGMIVCLIGVVATVAIAG